MKPDLEPPVDGQETVSSTGSTPPEIRWDDGLGFRAIMGDTTPGNPLLKLIAERIRVAANYLHLTRYDLFRILAGTAFSRGKQTNPVSEAKAASSWSRRIT